MTCQPGTVESHAPGGYRCPFCRNIREGKADHPLEVVHRDDEVFVKMNPKWWPNNPGSVLVVPVHHYENIFDLPVELATPIQRAARSAAIAMKSAFGCDGISIRQHNEPAGNQDVWHYHLHVFPRWHGDDLYQLQGSMAPAGEVRARADQLRRAWPAGA
ncbi:MAG: histidine triad family protein [Acidimicrobiaceae bacterium]